MAKGLEAGDRVFLEGPMGVGKTTFARLLLQALQVQQPPEGSPTFAIAHEYQAPLGGIVHIDFYRIQSEEEIDDAGIPAYYWERKLLVISEWISSWPEFEHQVVKTGRVWRVSLSFSAEQENTAARDVTIQTDENFGA